jgi:hypothetical protein
MAETIANLGYLAMSVEVTKGVLASVPDIYAPIYDATFETDTQVDEDQPIIGNKFERYQALLGQRAHTGEVTLLAEPNTTGHLMNMLLTKGTTTGGAPYTHPFTLSATTNPKSYTIDIAKAGIVTRFLGCEISELESDFDKNKMVWKAKFSALKSFAVREIASVTGTSTPWTITFKTNYDPVPTDGIKIGDTLQLYQASAGTTINFVVASIVNDTDITTTTDVDAGVAGDLVYIRPATPTYALKAPFMWATTEFHFANNVTDALAAAQTRVEQGSKFKIVHKFEEDAGAARSGSFDPAALVRTTGDVEFETKIYFDNPKDYNWFLTAQVRACVIKIKSEAGVYEFKLNVNGFAWKEAPVKLKSGEILYLEGKLIPVYNVGEGQAFSAQVINNVAAAAM